MTRLANDLRPSLIIFILSNFRMLFLTPAYVTVYQFGESSVVVRNEDKYMIKGEDAPSLLITLSSESNHRPLCRYHNYRRHLLLTLYLYAPVFYRAYIMDILIRPRKLVILCSWPQESP